LNFEVPISLLRFAIRYPAFKISNAFVFGSIARFKPPHFMRKDLRKGPKARSVSAWATPQAEMDRAVGAYARCEKSRLQAAFSRW